MGLMLKTQRDEKLRADWYGVYTASDGKRKVVNLNIRWQGTPPASGRVGDAGDGAFERSREKAEDELARFVDESRRKGRSETLTERLIESKTGRAVEYTRIDELPERWRQIGRAAQPSEAHLSNCDAHFARFVSYMNENAPGKRHLYEVNEDDVKGFVELLRRTLAPATAQYGVRLLNKAFERCLPVGAKNCFADYVGQRGHPFAVIHRKPFSPEELKALLFTSRDDPFLFPLIVCAASTGMRRGDVCRLKWEDVDLSANGLTVKTSKTGADVEIEIWPILRGVLEQAKPKRKGFVWPEAARLLEDNPHALSRRFKNVVAVALGGFIPEAAPEPVPLADMLNDAFEAICKQVPEGTRRERMRDVIQRYANGQGVRQIQKETGISRATISADLNAVELWTGRPFNRRGAGRQSKQSMGAAVQRLTRMQREGGQNAASIYDWHALRTTWITLALAAGVPIEIVRRVTGHASVEIVLKHYFRPGREQFRAALANALPEVLTGEKAKRLSAGDELAELAAKIQTNTATPTEKKRLRLLAAKV